MAAEETLIIKPKVKIKVFGVGGGGSTSELTNWDGTKKNTGWGI